MYTDLLYISTHIICAIEGNSASFFEWLLGEVFDGLDYVVILDCDRKSHQFDIQRYC